MPYDSLVIKLNISWWVVGSGTHSAVGLNVTHTHTLVIFNGGQFFASLYII